MSPSAPRRFPVLTAAAALALTLAASGCGLKGALTMPSQSEEIVIRPAPAATTDGAAPAAPESTPGPAAPAPTEKKVKPPDDRLPPPPLPGGNPGTARSG